MHRVSLHIGVTCRVSRPFVVLYKSIESAAAAPATASSSRIVLRTYSEVGRSETIPPHFPPTRAFVRTFLLALPENTSERYRVALYDRRSDSRDLEAHVFCGSVLFVLGDVVGSDGFVVLPLRKEGRRKKGEGGRRRDLMDTTLADVRITLRAIAVNDTLFAERGRVHFVLSLPPSRCKTVPYSSQVIDFAVADRSRGATGRAWLPIYRSESLTEPKDAASDLLDFKKIVLPEWRMLDKTREIRIRILRNERRNCLVVEAVAVTTLERLQEMDPVKEMLPLLRPDLPTGAAAKRQSDVAPGWHEEVREGKLGAVACLDGGKSVGCLILTNAEPAEFGGVFTLVANFSDWSRGGGTMSGADALRRPLRTSCGIGGENAKILDTSFLDPDRSRLERTMSRGGGTPQGGLTAVGGTKRLSLDYGGGGAGILGSIHNLSPTTAMGSSMPDRDDRGTGVAAAVPAIASPIAVPGVARMPVVVEEGRGSSVSVMTPGGRKKSRHFWRGRSFTSSAVTSEEPRSPVSSVSGSDGGGDAGHELEPRALRHFPQLPAEVSSSTGEVSGGASSASGGNSGGGGGGVSSSCGGYQGGGVFMCSSPSTLNSSLFPRQTSNSASDQGAKSASVSRQSSRDRVERDGSPQVGSFPSRIGSAHVDSFTRIASPRPDSGSGSSSRLMRIGRRMDDSRSSKTSSRRGSGLGPQDLLPDKAVPGTPLSSDESHYMSDPGGYSSRQSAVPSSPAGRETRSTSGLSSSRKRYNNSSGSDRKLPALNSERETDLPSMAPQYDSRQKRRSVSLSKSGVKENTPTEKRTGILRAFTNRRKSKTALT